MLIFELIVILLSPLKLIASKILVKDIIYLQKKDLQTDDSLKTPITRQIIRKHIQKFRHK